MELQISYAGGDTTKDRGFEPSGGEGQKIALAIALYRDAPMVVLDSLPPPWIPGRNAPFIASLIGWFLGKAPFTSPTGCPPRGFANGWRSLKKDG